MNSKTINFIASFTGIFLFGISMVMLGALLPILKVRFSLTDIEAGRLFSILPLGLLLGSISFGPIADKVGYRWVLSLASFFLAIGYVGIGHAPTIAFLRVCVFFFGMGGGVINGGTSALVSDLSEGKAKIINLNWLGLFYGVGAFSMPMLLSLINEKWYILVIDFIGILSLIVGAVFLVIKYPLTIKKEKVTIQWLVKFAKHPLMLSICFFLFFQSAFEALVNNWSVYYFINEKGLPNKEAWVALSASVAGLIAMRFAVGSFLKNLRPYQMISVAFMALIAGWICLFFFNQYLLQIAGMFFLGNGLAMGFPVMLGIIGDIFKEVSGTAFSFAMFIALIGNTIINYLTGIFIETYGSQVYGYVIMAVILFMMSIFLLIKRKTIS